MSTVSGFLAADPAHTPHLAAGLAGMATISSGRLTVAVPPKALQHVGEDGSVVVGWGDLATNVNVARVRDTVQRHTPDALRSIAPSAAWLFWNGRTETLQLIRPADGPPGVFWHESPAGITFGGSIAALLDLGVPGEIDPIGLDAYMSCGYTMSPWSMVRGVSKLPASHQLVIADGVARTERYWEPAWEPKASVDEPSALKRELIAAVDAAVRTASHPALLLSGGVDSGLLAAIAVAELGIDLATFTYRYGGYEGAMNETEPAGEVAAYFGTRHHEISYSPDFLADNVDDLLTAYEEPLTYGLHTAKLADVKHAGVDVVLSGACTDGWYVGRPAQAGLRLADRLPQLSNKIGWLGTSLERIPNAFAKRAALATHHASTGVARLFYEDDANSVVDLATRRAMYRDPAVADTGEHRVLEHLTSLAAASSASTKQDRFTYLMWMVEWPDHLQWWNWRFASANGLIVRHPYVATGFADLQARLTRRGDKKAALREIAAGYMPALGQRRKFAQALPLAEWLRGPLRALLEDELAAPAVESDGIFDAAVLRTYADQHFAGRCDRRWELWTALAVSRWYRSFLKRSRPAAESPDRSHPGA